MYIQPERPIPPKNYSGSAFTPEGSPLFPGNTPRNEPLTAPPADPPAPDIPAEHQEPDAEVQPPTEEVPAVADAPERTVAASASPSHSGLLSRMPFLSSFLPPPRYKDGKQGLSLPDWVLIGAMALLFLSEEDNDILPFLLLLLLWD